MKPSPKTSLAVILGAQLRSGNDAMIKQAIEHLRLMVDDTDGNLLELSRKSGIAHRTLCRWLEDSLEFAFLVNKTRATAKSSKSMQASHSTKQAQTKHK